MTIITITVASVYYNVRLVLQGVPEDVTPYNITNGTEASPEYYIVPMAPFGNGILTSSVLGNDEISVNGYSGTYYTVTVIDIRSQQVIYEANFEITGSTYDLDTAVPLSGSPIPNTYATQDYVDTQISDALLNSSFIELESGP